MRETGVIRLKTKSVQNHGGAPSEQESIKGRHRKAAPDGIMKLNRFSSIKIGHKLALTSALTSLLLACVAVLGLWTLNDANAAVVNTQHSPIN